MVDSLHVTFCGGGSGGHIYPSISVAEAIWQRRPEAKISFVTSSREIDHAILKVWLTPKEVDVFPLCLESSARRFRYTVNLLRSTLHCIQLFRQQRPSVVLGTGGFASLPGILAARWHRVPIVLFEANRIPGRASRRLARFAKMTFSGWDIQSQYASDWPSPISNSGIPVRAGFRGDSGDSLGNVLLVLGGSLGATSVNNMVTRAVAAEDCLPQGWKIRHQTGPENVDSVTAAYRDAGIQADVQPFLNDVASAMKSATLVISRAGALSLAELAAVGRAAILVPMVASADGHQSANAQIYSESGAAAVVDESAADSVKNLSALLARLSVDKKSILQMQNAAAGMDHPEASHAIADFLIETGDTGT